MLINHHDHVVVVHPDPDFRSPYRTAGNAQTFANTLLRRQKQTGVIPRGKKQVRPPHTLYNQITTSKDRKQCKVKTDLNVLDNILKMAIILYDRFQTGGIFIFIFQLLKVNRHANYITN